MLTQKDLAMPVHTYDLADSLVICQEKHVYLLPMIKHKILFNTKSLTTVHNSTAIFRQCTPH